jgi:hypothetical protein
MALKNMKNIDFKHFFVHQGEKVGLWICVGAMALLLILMIKDVVAGPSASANAEKLASLSKDRKQKIDTSQPTDDIAKVDPKIQEASSPVDVPQDLYGFHKAFFDPAAAEDKKWRLPTVLLVDEFRVDYMHADVPSLMLFPKGEGDQIQVGILVTRGNPDISQKNKENIAKSKKLSAKAKYLQKLLKQIQQMQGGGMMGPGGGGMAPGGGMPGMPGGGMPGPPGGMGAMMGMMMGQGGQGGGKFGGGGMGGGGMGGMMGEMMGQRMQAYGQGGGSQDLEIRPVPESEAEGKELAEQIEPYRMVIITGAFPYKAQLDQFKTALRFKSVDEMLNNPDIPGGVEFSGLSVQRRQARLGESFDKQEWQDLPVEASMKAVMILATEPDKSELDKKLEGYGIIPHPNRTVMVRPKLDDRLHAEKYPEELPQSVQDSLTAMEKAGKPAAAEKQRRTSRFDTESYNVYGGDDTGSTTEQPNSNQRQGELKNEQEQETVRPEKTLIRFYDVTVRPGMQYQYKVSVRMANPCYKKTDKAVSKNVTLDKEIRGQWAQLPETVTVPEEKLFYAVDEKRNEGTLAFNDRIAMQIHNWLEQLQPDPNNRNAIYKVGDWSVLEREWVKRGEFIGEVKETEVPIWWPTLKKYLFAGNTEERKRGSGGPRRRPQGIPVDFNTGALLVDFEGGKRNYQVGAVKITDESPIEALVLTADGKLLVHNSKVDAENKERTQRYDEWKKTQEKVKEEADNMKAGTNPQGFQGLLNNKSGGK